jgi:oligoribonuclease NrnB/cAMP/cGMP phosphodiesterase (DHH superfamily)
MQLEQERIMNVTCIHHGDADGIAAAIVLMDYIHEKRSDLVDHVHFIQADDYKIQLPLENEELFNPNTAVFILDYSVENSVMDKLYHKVAAIYWYDHHVSAIQNMWFPDQFDESATCCLVETVVLPEGYCGAEITWAALWKDLHMYYGHPAPWTYNNMNYFIGGVIVSKEAFLEQFKDIPEWLRRVGDWDIYRNPSTYTFTYKMWFDAHVHITSDGIYGRHEENDPTTHDVDDAVNSMREAYNYYMYLVNNLVRQYAKECHISRYGDIHAVMLPVPPDFGSRAFLSIRDEYEVGVLMHYNGERFRYSFYRLGENPNKFIDCSEIARTYGGGGHHGAAGCRTNWEIVKPKA